MPHYCAYLAVLQGEDHEYELRGHWERDLAAGIVTTPGRYETVPRHKTIHCALHVQIRELAEM